jgi:uracil phosphoribosyltransferase
MRVWRICKAQHVANAFTGEGALAYAGRWHHRGTPVVYAPESRALAALEQLVHLHRNRLPPHFVCFAVDIPDELAISEVRIRDLPGEWRRQPGPLELQDIGTHWAKAGKTVCLGPIPRAGNGLLDGLLDLMPSARVGHVGLYRDPATLAAVEYYCKLPEDIAERLAIVLDPMLATGNSAVAAVDRVKSRGPKSIKLMCLLAAPEGIKTLHDTHPDVPIWTCAVDEKLNAKGYIVPGLGDAGDRLFGTK